MTVDDDSGSDLNEEPGGDQGQAAVLTVEAIVIGVEGKVVQIEESGNKQQQHVASDKAAGKGIRQCWSHDIPQPVTFAGIGVAADGIILISQPHDEDDVEGSRCIIEKL